ncbi:MAG: ArnT family glycosyltransferase [Bacillota bacterium]
MIALLEKLSAKKALFMIVLLFIPLFMFYLSRPGLWDEDESVYAEISRQMVSRHDYVGTYFNYEPRYDKPPLNFWINTFFYKLFGMTEFSSRLGSTLFSFLGLILMYSFGKRLFNKRVGIMAALMIGTAFLYFVETQMALIDTTLTFMIGLILYLFYLGVIENRSNLLIWMGMPLGLGILAKGPVALILSGGVGLIFWLFLKLKSQTNWRSLFNWQLLAGFAVAAAICLPWYWAMWSRYGMDFISSHFGYHMIDRFTKPLEGHGGEWYFSLYYLIMLFIGFMPWSAYIPGSVTLAVKRWSEPNMFFLLSWAAITFAFFTVAQTKLPGYTLPLFPPVALLMGYWWDQLLTVPGMRSNPWWGIAIQLLIVTGFVVLIVVFRSYLPQGYENAIWVLFLLPASLIAGAIAIIILRRRDRSYEPFFKVTFFTFYLFWALFLMLLVPIIENFKPVKYLAVDLRGHLTDKDRVVSYIPSNYTAPFYTRHKVDFVHNDQDFKRIYTLKTRVYAFVSADGLKYLWEQRIPCYQLSHFGSGYLISNQAVNW